VEQPRRTRSDWDRGAPRLTQVASVGSVTATASGDWQAYRGSWSRRHQRHHRDALGQLHGISWMRLSHYQFCRFCIVRGKWGRRQSRLRPMCDRDRLPGYIEMDTALAVGNYLPRLNWVRAGKRR
jgi:hypothetical protein